MPHIWLSEELAFRGIEIRRASGLPARVGAGDPDRSRRFSATERELQAGRNLAAGRFDPR
jgi:hypothetical protein